MNAPDKLDWWGLKVSPLSDERLAEICDVLGHDTDFDQYGFHLKRADLRSLLAEVRHHRLTVRKHDR